MKPIIKGLFLLFFLGSPYFIFAQSPVSEKQDNSLDSLKRVLQNPKVHDTVKLYGLAVSMDLYGQNDPNYIEINKLMGKLALQKYQENGTKELRQKYANYLAVYYNNLGSQYLQKRDIINAMAYTDKSIAIFKASGLYNEMYFIIISKAITLGKINEYDKAIALLFSALKHFEKDKTNGGEEICYAQSSIAKLYSDFGKYDKAIEYDAKVIRHYEMQAELTIQDELILATAHLNSGSSWLQLKKYPQATNHFNKAFTLFTKTGDINNRSVTLTKMAVVKMEESKFSEAETLLKQSVADEIAPVYTANAFVKFGMLYNRKRDFKMADFYLTKGLALSRENNVLELQEQASGLLINVSRENGNFEKALEMYEVHQKLIDETKTEASKNLLAQQQLKYDFEKRELNFKLAAAKESATKNNFLIGLSAIVLLLASGGYFYYRNNRQRQAIAALEKNQIKQKLLISQMNPHFIFNSVQNIGGLILDEKYTDAVNYLNKFSKLTRQILENSNENYISLEEEIDMIENYLSIQQLLYSNSFSYDLKVTEDIETDSVFLPPMLTQPFIENAIKHGLSGKTNDGKIAIHFYMDNGRLFFEVADNGKGFDASQKQSGHKSMAMAITKERLANYTKNQEFEIITATIKDDSQNVLGAKVVFEIPYVYEN